MDVSGKVALVTGAALRIGRALALALASHGARLIVHYNRSETEAQTLMEEIRTLGTDAVGVKEDFASGMAHRAIEEGQRAFGQVDILVNSAAVFGRGTILDTTEADLDRHLNVNLKAPFFLCQAYARQLQKGQRGHVINIADWRVLRPRTGHIAYTLAKSGLVTLTQSLALALAPDVQVNAIAPGAILPPTEDDGGHFAGFPARIPMRRIGSPEEVARAMMFLLESDFVTGEVILVTGGEHL